MAPASHLVALLGILATLFTADTGFAPSTSIPYTTTSRIYNRPASFAVSAGVRFVYTTDIIGKEECLNTSNLTCVASLSLGFPTRSINSHSIHVATDATQCPPASNDKPFSIPNNLVNNPTAAIKSSPPATAKPAQPIRQEGLKNRSSGDPSGNKLRPAVDPNLWARGSINPKTGKVRSYVEWRHRPKPTYVIIEPSKPTTKPIIQTNRALPSTVRARLERPLDRSLTFLTSFYNSDFASRCLTWLLQIEAAIMLAMNTAFDFCLDPAHLSSLTSFIYTAVIDTICIVSLICCFICIRGSMVVRVHNK